MNDNWEQEYIAKFRAKLPSKIHALMLGTGYVESASWSKLLLIHQEGFDSLFDAFKSIRECLISSIGYNCQYQKKEMPEGQDLIFEIQDSLRDIIHGDLQIGGEFWEAMDCEGWEFPGFIPRNISKFQWLLVDCAPELISIEREIPESEDEPDFWHECKINVSLDEEENHG